MRSYIIKKEFWSVKMATNASKAKKVPGNPMKRRRINLNSASMPPQFTSHPLISNF